MNSASFFGLAVRLVGLILLGIALPGAGSVISALAGMIRQAIDGYAPGVLSIWQWLEFLAYILGSILQILLALYLLSGGRFFVRRALRDAELRCPGCGYALQSLAGPRCPECGIKLSEDQPNTPGPATPAS